MNIDAILAGLPDLDDDAIVPQSPRTDDLVAMDDAFTASDYALETEATAPTFTKRESRKRVVKRVQKRKRIARTGSLDAEVCRTLKIDFFV